MSRGPVEYDDSFNFSFSSSDLEKLKERADKNGNSVSEEVRSIMKKNLQGEPRELEPKTEKLTDRKQVFIRLNSSMKKSVMERAEAEGVSVRRFVTEGL